MPQYDPQRSHRRRRSEDDEGPAPVDALLGPDPSTAAAPLFADAPGGPSMPTAPDEAQPRADAQGPAPLATPKAAATVPPVSEPDAGVTTRETAPVIPVEPRPPARSRRVTPIVIAGAVGVAGVAFWVARQRRRSAT